MVVVVNPVSRLWHAEPKRWLFSNNDNEVREVVNDRGVCILECSCGERQSACDHIAKIVTSGKDGTEGFAALKVSVPFIANAEDASLRSAIITLKRAVEDGEDDLGIAEMWMQATTRALPVQTSYLQNRDIHSALSSINVGLRLPGEGRMAMYRTLCRFLDHMSREVTCSAKGHLRTVAKYNPGKRRRKDRLAATYSILISGWCHICTKWHDASVVGKINPDDQDLQFVPDI